MILYTFQGEAPTVCGRVFQRRITRGDTYAEERTFVTDLHGDMGVLDFWAPCRMCDFDVHIVVKDAASYYGRHPHKILSRNERRQKGKYLETCLKTRRHFMSLVFSVDGVMEEEKKSATKQLAAALSNKWDRKYSERYGYVQACLPLKMVWAFSFLV